MLNWLRLGVGSLFSLFPFVAWIVLFGLGGGILGLGTFTLNYASGLSYLSDDPKACANCHVMREMYDDWNRGPHHSFAVCNDCHVPHDSLISKYAVKAFDGFKHSKAFTLNEIPDTITIDSFDRGIAQENCLRCHGDLVSEISHVNSKEPTDCLTCHQGVGHER